MFFGAVPFASWSMVCWRLALKMSYDADFSVGSVAICGGGERRVPRAGGQHEVRDIDRQLERPVALQERDELFDRDLDGGPQRLRAYHRPKGPRDLVDRDLRTAEQLAGLLAQGGIGGYVVVGPVVGVRMVEARPRSSWP